MHFVNNLAIRVVMGMDELYSKIDSVKEELNKLPIFDEIEKLVDEIQKKKELVEKIRKYNECPSDSLRMDIYSYEEIRKYKEKETDVNILILSMNKKIKDSLLEKGDCRHESN